MIKHIKEELDEDSHEVVIHYNPLKEEGMVISFHQRMEEVSQAFVS